MAGKKNSIKNPIELNTLNALGFQIPSQTVRQLTRLLDVTEAQIKSAASSLEERGFVTVGSEDVLEPETLNAPLFTHYISWPVVGEGPMWPFEQILARLGRHSVSKMEALGDEGSYKAVAPHSDDAKRQAEAETVALVRQLRLGHRAPVELVRKVIANLEILAGPKAILKAQDLLAKEIAPTVIRITYEGAEEIGVPPPLGIASTAEYVQHAELLLRQKTFTSDWRISLELDRIHVNEWRGLSWLSSHGINFKGIVPDLAVMNPGTREIKFALFFGIDFSPNIGPNPNGELPHEGADLRLQPRHILEKRLSYITLWSDCSRLPFELW